jgi:hypothetical protein
MSTKRLMKRATYREPTQDMDRGVEKDSKKAKRKDFVKATKKGGVSVIGRDMKLHAKRYYTAHRISQISCQNTTPYYSACVQ